MPLYEVARRRMGRPLKYDDPQKIWLEALNYFRWAEANPIWEARPFAYQGEVTLEQIPHRRAWTIQGLRLYLGVNNDTWRQWRTNPKFSSVVAAIEEAIYEQKLTGAAADQFNANIISRELGLADKQEHNTHHSGSMNVATITRVIVRPDAQDDEEDAQ